MPVQTQIQQRRGTAASWTSTNPTLAAGEIGFESDTNRFKIGNGSTAWASLSYWVQDPVTTKGDLYTFSTTDARLAVGANGETLVADSSTSTGLRYQGLQAAGKNTIINGGFDIWQRGTTGFSAGGNYCADRWICALNSGTLAVSRSTDVPTSPYFNYSLSMVGTTASNAQIFTRIESSNATLFAGQTVTLSLWAKNGGGTTKLSYVGLYPTATDNFASNTTDVSGDLTATSWSGSWTRYSVTFTANALATRGYMILLYRNGTETSTTLFAGVQLEIGSVATSFSRAGATIQGELAACQRYFWQWATGNGAAIGMGSNYSATQAETNVQFPVTMRVGPTLIQSTGTGYYAFQRNGGFDTFNSFTANTATTQLVNLYNNSEISGTAGNAGTMFTANAAASLAFSAEL
jgi:hypothetical protein